MCELHAYDKRKYKSTGATYFHGGRLLSEYSSVNPIIYICVTINFIETWINTLDKNITWRFLAYQDNTKEIIKKIQK